jgi:hypothetical protein
MCSGEHDLACFYEQLRSEVLGEERCVRQSLGWSHFVRHGMSAWMQAWTLLSPEPAERMHIAKDVVSWPLNEAVSLLANMALGCLAGVRQ